MIDEAKIAAYLDSNATSSAGRKLWDGLNYEERREVNRRYVEKVRAEAAQDVENYHRTARALD